MKKAFLLLFLATSSLFLASCGKDTSACFSTDKTIITTDDALKLTPCASNESYQWDFGDGLSSVEQSPTHHYAKRGSYTITLTTTNGRNKDTQNQKIEVTNPSDALVGVWDADKLETNLEIIALEPNQIKMIVPTSIYTYEVIANLKNGQILSDGNEAKQHVAYQAAAGSTEFRVLVSDIYVSEGVITFRETVTATGPLSAGQSGVYSFKATKIK